MRPVVLSLSTRSSTDANRREKRVPLATDRIAAQAMLLELVQRVERQRAGLEDPAEEQMRRPMAQHIKEFKTYLQSRNVTQRHVTESLTHIRKMPAAGRWRGIGDIDSASVTKFLGDPRAKGRSAQTYNHYLESIKHFTRWLEREQRIIRNPIAHISRLNVKADRRHERQVVQVVRSSCLWRPCPTIIAIRRDDAIQPTGRRCDDVLIDTKNEIHENGRSFVQRSHISEWF